MPLLLLHLSWGSTGVPTLLVEVTRAHEAATATEAARAEVEHVMEASAQEPLCYLRAP
jgi:hypothetical protein